MKKTRIERLETILWSRWLLIKIHAEDGTVGTGHRGHCVSNRAVSCTTTQDG